MSTQTAGPRTGSGTTARAGRRTTAPSRKPSLRTERALFKEGFRVIAGMDEVGRGALAGPVTVGVVLIDAGARSAPVGVKDSKLLTPARREALVGPVRRWALAHGVGHASPVEIDEVGIMVALRRAGRRALAAATASAGVVPDLVVLDGNHDWLTDPASVGLLALLDVADLTDGVDAPCPPVRTMIKADMRCSSVAAASILAKVERDGLLVDLAATHPDYRFDVHKGYAAPEHLAALALHGPCPHHRQSWNLPQRSTPPQDELPGIAPLLTSRLWDGTEPAGPVP